MPILLDGDGSIGGVSGLGGGNFQATSLETTSGGLLVHEVSSNRYTLRVDATNNTVGINTSSAPAAGVFLQVADATDPIVSLNNTGNGEVRLGCTAAAGYIGTESNHPFNIETNSAIAATVSTNGFVGIGTESPTTLLNVVTNYVGGDNITDFQVDLGGAVRIERNHSRQPYVRTDMGSGRPRIQLGNNAGDNAVIDTVGNSYLLNSNLGLGTNAPTAKLDVRASARAASFTGNGIEVLFSAGSNVFIGTQSGTEGKIGTVNNAPMAIFAGNSYTERVEVRTNGDFYVNNGNVVFPNGFGIDFSATEGASATSSVLDDYEEGTWTPATTQMGNITSSGRYTKIGRIVYYEGVVTRTSGATLAANIEITGLPYNVSNISAVVTGNYWLDEGGPSANNGDVTGSTYTVGTSVFLIYPTSSIYPASTRYVQGTNVTQNRGISFFGWYVT